MIHLSNLKQKIRPYLPKSLLRLYNRTVSKRIIRRIHGDWLDVEWKKKAFSADHSTWIKAYDESWDHWQQPDLSSIDISRLKELIPGCDSLLDAGCGDGFLLHHLKDKYRKGYGVDLSGAGLKIASGKQLEGCTFTQSYLEALPFPDKCFDVVVSTHTLEHVKNLQQAVDELKRITGKYLFVLVPSQEYVTYSPDYHLHFFPREEDLLNVFAIKGAECVRYTIPPGECAYSGDVLLLASEI